MMRYDVPLWVQDPCDHESAFIHRMDLAISLGDDGHMRLTKGQKKLREIEIKVFCIHVKYHPHRLQLHIEQNKILENVMVMIIMAVWVFTDCLHKFNVIVTAFCYNVCIGDDETVWGGSG
jgi:hypothetical protein